MTAAPESNLDRLLATLEPVLHEGTYAYCSVPHGPHAAAAQAIATFREAEGLTLVLPEAEAARHALAVLFRAAWITLTVHSDLQAVGLTAAFAGALGQAGISCNVMAAAYHDHLFVPAADAQRALACLQALQQRAAAAAAPT